MKNSLHLKQKNMLKIKFVIIAILLSCLSCNQNNLPEDNADTTLRSIKGGLLYSSFYDRWEIQEDTRSS